MKREFLSIVYVCLATTVVLALLRIIGVISASWAVVLSPIWLPSIIILVSTMLAWALYDLEQELKNKE